MMTSFLDNIPVIVKTAHDLKPKSILDVGCGFGKFGLLIKEALLSTQAETGDLKPEKAFRIDTVEMAEYFLKQREIYDIYDNVMSKDARLMRPEDLRYDLILLIDVIEHWSKQDFWDFMAKVPVETKVLISTPKGVVFYEQDYYGIEKHITQFSDFDFEGINLSTKDSFIYLM